MKPTIALKNAEFSLALTRSALLVQIWDARRNASHSCGRLRDEYRHVAHELTLVLVQLDTNLLDPSRARVLRDSSSLFRPMAKRRAQIHAERKFTILTEHRAA